MSSKKKRLKLHQNRNCFVQAILRKGGAHRDRKREQKNPRGKVSAEE